MSNVIPLKKKAMTVADAAEKFGVCKHTIYALVRRGQIPHFRIGAKILFHEHQLDAWSEKNAALSVSEG